MAKYRYVVSVFKPDHGEVGTHLDFFTDRIGINLADSRSTNSVTDEATGRALLGDIRAQKQLSIVVPDDNSYLIHQFHLLPLHQNILDVTIDLLLIRPRECPKQNPHQWEHCVELAREVSQIVASLTLRRVSLLAYRPNKVQEWYADLKVTGKAELANPSEDQD